MGRFRMLVGPISPTLQNGRRLSFGSCTTTTLGAHSWKTASSRCDLRAEYIPSYRRLLFYVCFPVEPIITSSLSFLGRRLLCVEFTQAIYIF